MLFTKSILLTLFPSLIAAQSSSSSSGTSDPSTSGNCVSGRIRFNAERAVAPASNVDPVDPLVHDVIVDYGGPNMSFGPPGVSIQLRRNGNLTADGGRLSTSRYMLYGKVTLRSRAVAVNGVITTFITRSKRGDTINWELVGGRPNEGVTNVFYKDIPEFSVHNISAPVSGGIGTAHTYTIDWKSNEILWQVDGVTVRTLSRENSTSPLTPPGERWFPSTPSQIQLGIWDAGSSKDNGTVRWAGGPIPWDTNPAVAAQYEYLEIQCYDDKNQPVPVWPPGTQGNITYPPSNAFYTGNKLPSPLPRATDTSSAGRLSSYLLWALPALGAFFA